MELAVSHFMPTRNIQWNDVTGKGNPTRSVAMARLIKTMKRFQTQQHGMSSQVRRPLTPQEYEAIIEPCWKLDNKELALSGAAFFSMQLSMIGRVDDMAKFREEDFQAYEPYPDYGITARLPWSKNVSDERDFPRQPLYGPIDPHYCPLANLGPWLEYHYELFPGENAFIFSYSGLDGPIYIKEKI